MKGFKIILGLIFLIIATFGITQYFLVKKEDGIVKRSIYSKQELLKSSDQNQMMEKGKTRKKASTKKGSKNLLKNERDESNVENLNSLSKDYLDDEEEEYDGRSELEDNEIEIINQLGEEAPELKRQLVEGLEEEVQEYDEGEERSAEEEDSDPEIAPLKPSEIED